jgi:hypothetical protein
MDYAVNPAKTEMQYLVSGVNCDPDTAREQMLQTKLFYKKLDKRMAYHAYQSFAAGEVTPDTAHHIGVELAREIWGSRFEVVIATHLDKDHIHNHFVLNSVSFADGKKFHSDCKSYFGIMRTVSDRLCREHGLSVIEPGKGSHTLAYREWLDETAGKDTVRSLIRQDIDAAVDACVTWTQFIQTLKKKGYDVKTDVKYMAVRPPLKDRYIRLRSLGDEYAEDRLRERIYSKRLVREAGQPPTPSPMVYHCRGTFKQIKRKKLKGFRALYWRYIYMFRSIRKRPLKYQARAFFGYRKELLKLRRYNEEMKLLCIQRIDTLEQLKNHMASLSQQINALLLERKEVYAAKRKYTSDVLNGQAAVITQKLKPLRKDLRLCQSIETRTAYIIQIREQERSNVEKENAINKKTRERR